jgi:hypothetical protein
MTELLASADDPRVREVFRLREMPERTLYFRSSPATRRFS